VSQRSSASSISPQDDAARLPALHSDATTVRKASDLNLTQS
jgi:hypothetical protein